MYRQSQLTQLLSDRRILIAGYGREGKSTHALLEKLLPGQSVDIACNDAEIYDHLDRAAQQGRPYDLIVKSPGISTMKFEGRCDLDTITSQTDLFLQVYHDITVGVTGTKGKSTTTTLIHHVLSHAYTQRRVVLAGNMGIPLFDIIEQIDAESLVVAEFSCHQLENIHRAPGFGVILNLYQEHLDHYHSYRDYQMAKMQLMLRQEAGDHCFYCCDSDDLRALVSEVSATVVSQLHPYSYASAMEAHADQLESHLQGPHNVSNIFVAQQLTGMMSVSQIQFADALSSFTGLPHRLELVGTYQGIIFYNDSISTIPEACIAAVKALRQVDTLILGGFDRGIDYSPLAQFLSTSLGEKVRNIAFVGEAGSRMHREWEALPQSPIQGKELLFSSDYPEIVAWCYQHTRAGHICLLSPAAASYDAFKNFEQRGDVYKQLIQEYSKR